MKALLHIFETSGIKSNKYFLFSLLYSIGFLLFVHFVFGQYYETYEHFHNYIIRSALSTKAMFDPIMNNDFFIFQLFILIQKKLPSIEVYAWARVFFLFIILWAISFFTLKLFRSAAIQFTLILCFSILVVEHLILINTNRSAFLLALSSILFLFLHEVENKRSYLYIFYALGIMAILNRIEDAGVLFAIGLLCSILFIKKRIALHLSLMLVFSLSASFSFYWINRIYFDYVHIFINNERRIVHQNNFIMNFEELASIVMGSDSTTDAEKLKIVGNALFILDEPTLNIHEVPKLVKYPSVIDYFFKNPDIVETFGTNLSATSDVLKKYGALGVLFVLLAALSYYYFKKFKWKAGRLALLLLIIMLIPAAISIFINVPERFFAPYLTAVLIALMFFLNYFLVKSNFRLLLNLMICGVGIIHFYFNTQTELHLKKTEDRISTVAHEKFLNDATNEDVKPMLLSILSWNVIPSELFATQTRQQAAVDFMILNHFDHSEFFKERKKNVFGSGYSSLVKRFDFIIQKNKGIIYGTELGLNFVSRYLQHVHNYYIDYEIKEPVYNEPGNQLPILKFQIYLTR